VQSLEKEFGRAFRGDYGWAADTLNSKRPTFASIEEAIGLQFIRPHYKLASSVIHVGPHAAYPKLGMLSGSEGILLTGISDISLDEPGRITAHALGQLTIDLISARTTLDTIVWTKIAAAFTDEGMAAFTAAQNALEREAKRSRRERS
jgi:hypothetical protein